MSWLDVKGPPCPPWLHWTEREKHLYIAGLVDGEGCISLNKISAGNRGLMYRVRVAMCDRWAVELCAAVFGGSISVDFRAPPRRPAYAWAVCSAAAYECCVSLKPYLTIKGRQAELLCATWEMRVLACAADGRPLSGSGSVRGKGALRSFNCVVDELHRRADEFRELNRRGVIA